MQPGRQHEVMVTEQCGNHADSEWQGKGDRQQQPVPLFTQTAGLFRASLALGIQPFSGVAGTVQRIQERLMIAAAEQHDPGLLAGEVNLGAKHAGYLHQRLLDSTHATGTAHTLQL